MDLSLSSGDGNLFKVAIVSREQIPTQSTRCLFEGYSLLFIEVLVLVLVLVVLAENDDVVEMKVLEKNIVINPGDRRRKCATMRTLNMIQ